jgi:hypothetical protein
MPNEVETKMKKSPQIHLRGFLLKIVQFKMPINPCKKNRGENIDYLMT